MRLPGDEPAPAKPAAYRLVTDGTGDPEIVRGTWDGGAFEAGPVVGRVSWTRTSKAWNAVGQEFEVDEPIREGSAIWVTPGVTRLSKYWRAPDLITDGMNAYDGATISKDTREPFSPAGSVLIDLGSGAEARMSFGPNTIDEAQEKGQYTAQGFFRSVSGTGKWNLTGLIEWEDTVEKAEFDLGETWSQHYLTWSHDWSNTTPYYGERKWSSPTLEKALVAVPMLHKKPYLSLPVLGEQGGALTVAPDDVAFSWPSKPKTLILDIAEYRGGESGGCLYWTPGGVLTIDPDTGEVVLAEGGTEKIRTTETVTPGGAAKIAISSDADEIRLCVDGGTVYTHSSSAALLAETDVRLGNYDDDGTLRSSLVAFVHPTAIDKALSGAQLQDVTS